MNWSECKSLIKSDFDRFNVDNGIGKYLKYYLFNCSFRVTSLFRIGSYLKTKRNILAQLLLFGIQLIHHHNIIKTGIDLRIGTVVGSGLMFSHQNCIIISHKAIIGSNVRIYQGVTVGAVRRNNTIFYPIIGDNVVISAGAKVIGGVRIGNDVVIGANAVVTKDIPDGAVVAGVPARILSMNGKEQSLLFNFA